MKKRKLNLKERTIDLLKSLCFLSPSLLGVGVFFIVPFGVVVYYSLIDGVGSKNFVFLQNFIKLFDNSAFLMAAKNTLSFSAVAVPLAVVLAMGLALMLECRIPLKSQFRTFFLSPMMVPVASVVLIWQVLFNYNGTINEFLMLFGADKIDWLQSDYCQIVVIILFLWKNLGFCIVIFVAALQSIPEPLYEYATLEGASFRQQAFNITLPLIVPSAFLVFILAWINAFRIFKEVYFIGGAYPDEAVYTLQNYMNNMYSKLNYQNVTTAAYSFAIIVFALFGVLFYIQKRAQRGLT